MYLILAIAKRSTTVISLPRRKRRLGVRLRRRSTGCLLGRKRLTIGRIAVKCTVVISRITVVTHNFYLVLKNFKSVSHKTQGREIGFITIRMFLKYCVQMKKYLTSEFIYVIVLLRVRNYTLSTSSYMK